MTSHDAALADAARNRKLGGRLIGLGIALVCGAGFLLVWGGLGGMLMALVGLGAVGVGLKLKRSADQALRV